MYEMRCGISRHVTIHAFSSRAVACAHCLSTVRYNYKLSCPHYFNTVSCGPNPSLFQLVSSHFRIRACDLSMALSCSLIHIDRHMLCTTMELTTILDWRFSDLTHCHSYVSPHVTWPRPTITTRTTLITTEPSTRP